MSRRPARASPSSRSWRDGSARPDRPRPPRWRVASWPSTVATPTAAIAALQEGVRTWCEVDAPYEAAEARVRLARALAADGDEAGARLEIKAAARSAEEIGAVVDLDIAPPRDRACRASRPHLPLLRHRGLDPTGRGDGRRRLGAAAALARPHPARRVRALAGRGGEARRRRVLRGLRPARRRHRVRGGDPAGPRPPSRRARLRAHRAHRAPRRRGDRPRRRLLRLGRHPGRPHLRGGRCRRGAGERRAASPAAGGRCPWLASAPSSSRASGEPVAARCWRAPTWSALRAPGTRGWRAHPRLKGILEPVAAVLVDWT